MRGKYGPVIRIIELDDSGDYVVATELRNGIWKVQNRDDKYTYVIKETIEEGIDALKQLLKKRELGIKPK